MDIEGPGDFGDGFSFFNEMASEGALLRPQFGRAPEGDAACLGGAPAFLGSGGDQRARELRNASKDGEHHASGRRRRIGPGLGEQALERGPLLAGAGGFLLEQLFAAGRVEAVALDGEILVGRGHARVPELHAPGSIALQILLQKTYISQIYYANDKSLFPHPAISLRNSLEICEWRPASGASARATPTSA